MSRALTFSSLGQVNVLAYMAKGLSRYDYVKDPELRRMLKLHKSFKLLNLLRLWEGEVKTREESEQCGTKEVHLRPNKIIEMNSLEFPGSVHYRTRILVS